MPAEGIILSIVIAIPIVLTAVAAVIISSRLKT